MSDTWNQAEWISVQQALDAGMPKELIEAAWRETDALLGTNMADTLVLLHLGDNIAPSPSEG